VNEQGITIRDVWDGVHLRLTFKKTVDQETLTQWEELMQIASSIQLSEDDDAIIWQYTSSGKYAVQSLYVVINNRAVKQIFTPVVQKILVPPRIHMFLWLFAKNKVLTMDNLARRKNLDDKSCLFCKEDESVQQVFFDCCVAKTM
jgi:hypothetical protein